LPPIDLEVAIERQNDGFGHLLAHPDQAGIGKRHGNIPVSSEKAPDRGALGLQAERDADETAMQEGDDSFPSALRCRRRKHASERTASQVKTGASTPEKTSSLHA
jgi:hypothetical protein